MIEPTIHSRPTYGTLSPRPGRAHLFAADEAGAGAILDMAAAAPVGFFAASEILLVSTVPGGETATRLAGLGAAVRVLPTTDALVAAIDEALAAAGMGLQVYAAGSEGLIGRVVAAAMAAGLDPSAVATEHRGGLARRVQCVHCKGFMEEVTTQPVTCAHCGLTLFVRDHYSRRLAAFQGVCINAEDRSEIVPVEEVFR
jgi:hypothetical protein